MSTGLNFRLEEADVMADDGNKRSEGRGRRGGRRGGDRQEAGQESFGVRLVVVQARLGIVRQKFSLKIQNQKS